MRGHLPLPGVRQQSAGRRSAAPAARAPSASAPMPPMPPRRQPPREAPDSAPNRHPPIDELDFFSHGRMIQMGKSSFFRNARIWKIWGWIMRRLVLLLVVGAFAVMGVGLVPVVAKAEEQAQTKAQTQDQWRFVSSTTSGGIGCRRAGGFIGERTAGTTTIPRRLCQTTPLPSSRAGKLERLAAVRALTPKIDRSTGTRTPLGATILRAETKPAPSMVTRCRASL